MKISFQILFIALFFFISRNNIYSQIDTLSCPAPDSIKDKYRYDADWFALQRIYGYHYTYEDSIQIPRIYSDTFLDPLIAVYNATSIPERDTVVERLDIHAFSDYQLNAIIISADSNLFWMQQLENGIIPTGYAPLDSLLSTYDFSLDRYSHFFQWDAVTFISDSNYNTPVLADLFLQLPGVIYSNPVHISFFAHNDIMITLPSMYNDYTQVYYRYAISESSSRSWLFNVYPGCGVEFVESFGDSLPVTKTKESDNKSISIHPNPFADMIRVDGYEGPFEYRISNLQGIEVMKGKSIDQSIDHLIGLVPGFYILQLKVEDQLSTFTIIKK